MQAQAVYENAAHEAASAQQVASQLQQAALANTANLQQQQQQQQLQQQLQVALAGFNLTAATPGLSSPFSTTAGVSSTTPTVPLTSAVGAPPALTPSLSPTAQSNLSTVAPLMNAAASAKQTAAQKQLESQAAAAAYQNAVQAASALEPSHAAMVNAVAQQAAIMYQTASNEAAVAADTAARLEQAANTVAVTVTAPGSSQLSAVPSAVHPVPASAPLAAHLAAGAMLRPVSAALPAAAHHASLSNTANLMQPPALATGLTPNVGTTALLQPHKQQQQQQQQQIIQTSAGLQPFPGTAVMTGSTGGHSFMPGMQYHPSGLQYITGQLPLQYQYHPAVQSTMGMSLDGLSYLGSAVPSGAMMSGTLSSLGGASGLSSPFPSSGLSSPPPGGGAGLNSSPAGLNFGFGPMPSSSISGDQGSSAVEASISPTPAVIKAVCSSGGLFIRSTGGSWDYEGEFY